MTHPSYSDTGLALMEWHLQVMRDPNMSLYVRIESASKLLELWPDQFPDTYHLSPTDLTYIINGQGIEVPDPIEPEPEPKSKVKEQDASVLGRIDHVRGWH
jgi:hypothetical protein